MKIQRKELKELNERIIRLSMKLTIITDIEEKAKIEGERDGILFTLKTLFNKEEITTFKKNEEGNEIIYKSHDYILKQ